MTTAVYRTGNITPLALGTGAALLAVLLVLAPWSVAIVGALGILWFSVTENETFLLLVIFLVPVACLRQVGPITDITTPLRLLVVIGFFAGRFLRGDLGLRRLMAPRMSKACVAFLIVAPISVLAGPIGWGHHSMSQSYQFASWVGFFFFIVAWVNSPKRLEKVLKTFLWSLCLVGVFAIIQVAVGGYTRLWLYLAPPGPDLSPWGGRASSFLGYPNRLSGYLDLSLPFALAATGLGRGRLRMFGAVSFGLGVAGLLCSQSLGGMISLVFTLGLAIWYFVRSRRNQIALACGLVFLVMGSYALRYLLNPAHFASSRLTMPVDIFSRLFYFRAAWVLFLSHPILGIGLGNFVTASPALVPNTSWMQIGTANLSASNLYLELLAETGLVGTLAFLYLLLLALRKARREVRSRKWHFAPLFGFGALGAVCAVVVHGCIDYLFYTQYGTTFFMILGLLLVSSSVRPRLRVSTNQLKNSGGSPACA